MTANENPKDYRASPPLAEKKGEAKDKAGVACAGRIQRIAAEPKKGARLIARTFYRELRRAGWTDDDIMTIADELLGCLIASLHEYRLKKEIPTVIGQGETAATTRGGNGRSGRPAQTDPSPSGHTTHTLEEG